MKKYNKLEIIGFIVLAVGTILFVTKGFLSPEFLSPIDRFGDILFWLGLLIWSLGYMQKEKTEHDQTSNE